MKACESPLFHGRHSGYETIWSQNPSKNLKTRLESWPLISWPSLLRQVVHDLERNPWRSSLTMLGLVIGSGAVVAVASVGLAGRD